jgi:predicted heme/steroid binding protein
MKRILRSASLFLALAAPAFAQFANGSFASDLGDWNVSGDVAVRDGAAFLTTAALAGGDDLSGSYNFSGNEVTASFPDLESLLGLGAGALDPAPLNFVYASEGSALFQSVSVQAGDVLGFDWTFLSNDDGGADYAFLVIDGAVFDLSTGSSLTSGTTYSYGFTTGPQLFQSTPFASAGTVTIGFGVVDVIDGFSTSALIIDNVALAPIPEPSAFAALAGLGALALAATRRRA